MTHFSQAGFWYFTYNVHVLLFFHWHDVYWFFPYFLFYIFSPCWINEENPNYLQQQFSYVFIRRKQIAFSANMLKKIWSVGRRNIFFFFFSIFSPEKNRVGPKILWLTYLTYLTSTSSRLFSLYRCFLFVFFQFGLVIGEVTCSLKLEGMIFPELVKATFEGIQGGCYDNPCRQRMPLNTDTLKLVLTLHYENTPIQLHWKF